MIIQCRIHIYPHVGTYKVYIPIMTYVPTASCAARAPLRQRSNYSYNIRTQYYIIIIIIKSFRASACALHIERDIPTGFLLLLIVQYNRRCPGACVEMGI